MALRLLVIDLPPLLRDLVAKALLRRDGEGVFVDLPASGGDVQALAVAARADAVVAALDDGGWPVHCARIVSRGSGLPVFGVAIRDGSGRISELRTVETRRTDLAVDELTIDEFIESAGRAVAGEPI
jgi:hypothetical protein